MLVIHKSLSDGCKKHSVYDCSSNDRRKMKHGGENLKLRSSVGYRNLIKEHTKHFFLRSSSRNVAKHLRVSTLKKIHK